MLSKAEPVSFKNLKMEVSPKIKSQIKSERIKLVENPEWKALRKNQSPTSLKIPNLKTKVMFGLAGLSLQIKIALVGSGRRSEDFRGPILSECRGCFTLQIDRFTMGGVKIINHRGKNRQNGVS